MQKLKMTYRADLEVLALLRARSESELSGSITVGIKGGTDPLADTIEGER